MTVSITSRCSFIKRSGRWQPSAQVRWDLGRCTRHLVYVLLAVVFSSSVAAAVQRQEAGARPPDPSSLAGEWRGTSTLLQRGDCPINRGGRVDTPVTMQLVGEPSGTFQGNILWRRAKEPSNPLLLRVKDDWSVEAEQLQQAVCRSVSREHTIRLTGKLTVRKGRYRVQLFGRRAEWPRDEMRVREALRLQPEVSWPIENLVPSKHGDEAPDAPAPRQKASGRPLLQRVPGAAQHIRGITRLMNGASRTSRWRPIHPDGKSLRQTVRS